MSKQCNAEHYSETIMFCKTCGSVWDSRDEAYTETFCVNRPSLNVQADSVVEQVDTSLLMKDFLKQSPLTSDSPPVCFKTNSAGTAVYGDQKWLKIDTHTPRGKKIQLINKASNCSTTGMLTSTNTFFDHWAPLPSWE